MKISPNSSDDTDSIVELSLRLAKAARRRLPGRLRDDKEE